MPSPSPQPSTIKQAVHNQIDQAFEKAGKWADRIGRAREAVEKIIGDSLEVAQQLLNFDRGVTIVMEKEKAWNY